MNTTLHTPSNLGIATSTGGHHAFCQKLATLTSLICNSTLVMIYEMDAINDVDGWTIWDNNGTICYWASIDEAISAVKYQIELQDK